MNFKHIFLFLVLPGIIYWEFILNINNEHAQNYSWPRATFAFCSHGEKSPWQGRLPGVVQQVSMLPRGKEKFTWRGKIDQGVSELPEAISCPRIMWTGPKRLLPSSRSKICHLQETTLIHQTGEILTGCFRKIAKKRGTQIASCAHIYMAFLHSLNWKSTMQSSPFLAIFWDTLYLSLIKPIHTQNV